MKATLGEIAAAAGGSIISGDANILVKGVCTDSRKIVNGALFIPLRGENFDGHDYISMSLSGGASACLTERHVEVPAGKGAVHVDDTRLALGRLAAWWRGRYSIPVIAVTGSVGKTTAKDMIASVLGQKYKTLRTAVNLNNDIGMPLTLLSLDETHECAVVEIGMNHFGEIRYLARILRPFYVVMTNIGDAHIENLGSREGILRAKSEVFEYIDPDGIAVVNGDDALLRNLRGTIRNCVIFCGEGECNARAEDIDISSGLSVSCSLWYKGSQLRVTIPSPGRHMVYPALFSLVLGKSLGLTESQIKAGIENFIPSKMRMDIKSLKNGVILLDDAYNANPQSMRSGIMTLSNINAARRIAVLGDMLELGDRGPAAHREIGKFCLESGIDCVFTTGDLGSLISETGPNSRHFPDKRSLISALLPELSPGTAVLVKASRGMRFEEIVKAIEENFNT
ncbi:MAG: UDP-N-acetylmuramoyl-tripeptide--D-alanyl-D-alanine ligase [Oscillospiraceae bacterium]|jgi:UDP-N-acetylmuramoyl-tripeptide--D-alanyl-D-alanine ligase